ncbi:MAG: BadF/BadG/BcrA/BcrD ATPase family protein, partial [Campylobacterales bacterium]
VLAVEHLHPEVNAVVELGGQDAKIIHFKPCENGTKTALTSMNDKCASGTGATIEKCTMKAGLGADELQALAFDPGKLHHVAAKCGVFAETDIVNLIKTSVPSNEIMNSLADAIVMQNLTVLTRGNTLMPNVLLLGGPNTYLPFLQQCWRLRIAQLWDERGIDYDPAHLDALVIVPEKSGGAVVNSRNDTPLAQSEAELAAFKKAYTVPAFTPVRPERERECYLGIDGGSTSSKAVLIDQDGTLLAKAYQLSRGNPIQDTLELLQQLQALDPRGRHKIKGLGVTGYAADVLEGALKADANVVETIAHMRSAQQVFGNGIDVICDIGGQDIKVLFLENGMMKNFRLSNQCSAGNGTLLQSMAKQFGVAMESYADVAFSATLAPRFNYGCAVFLDTDRVYFQKEGYSKENTSYRRRTSRPWENISSSRAARSTTWPR